MQDILSSFQAQFQEAVAHLKTDLSSLRTGRAHPSLIEGVMVEAYGTKMAISGVASVTIPDARTIVIEPWDKNVMKDVERALQESRLGFNPTVQGQVIRILLPALTEETRRNLTKVLAEKCEQARIVVRNVRDEAKAMIVVAARDKQITEDEKYKLFEQLDKNAAGFNERIKHMSEEKETEIMTM